MGNNISAPQDHISQFSCKLSGIRDLWTLIIDNPMK
jgi:hypothetical protein